MIDSTLKNANILIVDDQAANVEVLEGLLEIQGYNNIRTTTDPRVVVDIFNEFSPDLILLDLMMPHLSGFEVMEQLKQIVPSGTYLPILVLTADVTTESKQRALSGGASDFLIKPFDLIEVGLRIKNLLHSSYLQQLLQNQNQILEVKVLERTQELEKKNAELVIAKNRAEASDRLKTSFINNISHEIRTPLNGILGFGQILSDTDLTPSEKEEYLEMLNTSSDRLINTVTNFIDISLLASGNQEVSKREFELEPLIYGVVDKFSLVCSAKAVDLVVKISENCNNLKINTDKELFEKALFHLVDNAVKFTEHGFVVVEIDIKNGVLDVFVKDSGIGIAQEFHQMIFKSFSQEDPHMTRGYEGSGLGLSIAGGIIGLLGGKINMESEKGKGATFYFSLSCLIGDQGFDSRITSGSIKKTNNRYSILVAEDDEFNFFYINFLLKHDFIDILHAENGEIAVEICREHPEIAVVLMDLKMPEMDGFEATREIKSFRTDLPVIAVTAYSGTEDRKKAMMAGCDEFITKPVKKELLINTLVKFGIEMS